MNEVNHERARWLEIAVVGGLSAIPVVGGPISVVANEVLDRRRRRVTELGSELLSQHDAEDVLARLRSDERFGELFVRAAEAVAVTSWLPKRRAMGAVVRAVLDGDDAQLDDAELLLNALEELGAPHFAALQRLYQATECLDDDKIGVEATAVRGLIPPVLAALLRTGAATQQSGWGGLFYRSTEFGHRLLLLVSI